MLLQWKLLIVLVIVAVIAVAVARIAHYWHPRPDPRLKINEYEVVEVTSGVTLQVRGGLLGRRTVDVIMDGVIVPAKEPWTTQSKTNLEQLVGSRVRVESAAGLFKSSDEEQPTTLEARVIHGKVFGENGCCLQIAQLEAGLAETIGKVPAEYTKAQKTAKRNKTGMWGN